MPRRRGTRWCGSWHWPKQGAGVSSDVLVRLSNPQRPAGVLDLLSGHAGDADLGCLGCRLRVEVDANPDSGGEDGVEAFAGHDDCDGSVRGHRRHDEGLRCDFDVSLPSPLP